MAMELTGLEGAVTKLRAAGPKVEGEVGKAVARAAARTSTVAKANASGRPGPNVTPGGGNFRRSITSTPASSVGGLVTAYVGTNAVQGRRLELGFYGADSLGRVYAQPPYKWLGPAIPDARTFLNDEIRKLTG